MSKMVEKEKGRQKKKAKKPKKSEIFLQNPIDFGKWMCYNTKVGKSR